MKFWFVDAFVKKEWRTLRDTYTGVKRRQQKRSGGEPDNDNTPQGDVLIGGACIHVSPI